MAVKYLAGNRLWGTDAERLAMTTGGADYDDSNFVAWGATNNGSGGTVTVTDNVVSFSMTERDNNHTATVDLGSNQDDSAWVLRFKLNYTVLNGASSAYNLLIFGMASMEHSSVFNNSSIDHDGILLKQMLAINDASENIWGLVDYDSDGGGVHDPNPEMDVDPVIDTDYYVEIKRTADDEMSIGMYTDSTFGTPITGMAVETRTIPTAVNGLRYIRVGNEYVTSGTVSTTITGTARDFQFWDGVTTAVPAVYPSLPNGTVFITSDTNVHYMWNGTDTWNEVA